VTPQTGVPQSGAMPQDHTSWTSSLRWISSGEKPTLTLLCFLLLQELRKSVTVHLYFVSSLTDFLGIVKI
jgi:hypothetical protein